MMRFSIVFLFVTISVLNSILSNPELSADAAAARTATTAATAGLKCGVSGPSVNERIIGGEEAEPHTWPWQALLVCNRKNSGRPVYCGGSLIGNKWIITSAACVYTREDSEYDIDIRTCKIFLGNHYSPTSNKVEPSQVIVGIEKLYIHPDWRFSHREDGYNIALVKLNKTVQYNKNVSNICLPFGLPKLKVTADCYATGWGWYDVHHAEYAETLKQLKMQIHNDYSDCMVSKDASDRQICARSKSSRMDDDLCYGDVGGPLACKEKNGRTWYLRGVASYLGDDCSRVTSFANVTAFEEWISKTMKK